MLMLGAGAGALDYFPCRYGGSRAVFRGPERDLSGPYIAMLGGSPTFGKYVATPYPALVEQALGHPVANLGGLNAGPDFYLSDQAALAIAARARVAVVQITGAEAMSNPFYTVHSRRNDRFLAATPALRALYPEVDFTDIHFTRHLLMVLARAGQDRFGTVVAGLKANWTCRMQRLLARLPGQRLLLWLADAPPPDMATELAASGPLFIDADMIAALRPLVSDLVEAVPSAAARAEGLDRMQVPETEHHAARCLPGPSAHDEVAEALAPVVARLMTP
ncbi:DUF6473 family protein [Tabrizicola sp.]|uniref:DUF6473 family protein n=1 Tax=Tabrizicola sp. TaxID=2005166 RepID=UPI003F34BC81